MPGDVTLHWSQSTPCVAACIPNKNTTQLLSHLTVATPIKPLLAQKCSRRKQLLTKTYPITDTCDHQVVNAPRDMGVLTCGKTTASEPLDTEDVGLTERFVLGA